MDAVILSNLGGFALVATALVLSPGPDTLMIMKNTHLYGRRAGYATVVGIQLGLLIHGFFVSIGLSLLLQSYPASLSAIGIGGGGYLMWIAYELWRGGVLPAERGDVAQAAHSGSFYNGLISNLLNPKVILIFIVLMPNFVDVERRAAPQFAALIAILLGINTLFQSGLVFFLNRARDFLNRYRDQVRYTTSILIFIFGVTINRGPVVHRFILIFAKILPMPSSSSDTASAAANRWHGPDGEYRLLHDINPIRLALCAELINNPRDCRLLDVGCGGGIFAHAIAERGVAVLGIDNDRSAIDAAIAQREESDSSDNPDYRVLPADDIAPAQLGVFDIVTCFEMLEHHRQPQRIVAAIASVLKPGGTAIFSTINRTVGSWIMMIGILEGLLRIMPKGLHDFADFIPPQKLASFCEQNHLAVSGAHGLGYDFFGHYWKLTDNLNVNYFLIAHKPHKQ